VVLVTFGCCCWLFHVFFSFFGFGVTLRVLTIYFFPFFRAGDFLFSVKLEWLWDCHFFWLGFGLFFIVRLRMFVFTLFFFFSSMCWSQTGVPLPCQQADCGMFMFPPFFVLYSWVFDHFVFVCRILVPPLLFVLVFLAFRVASTCFFFFFAFGFFFGVLRFRERGRLCFEIGRRLCCFFQLITRSLFTFLLLYFFK